MEKLPIILTWMGGKRRLFPEIVKHFPQEYFDKEGNFIFTGNFYEPFFGGGAIAFFLKPQRLVANDLNQELILTYNVIKNNPQTLYDHLAENYFDKNNATDFYLIRELDRNGSFTELNPIEKASRFIYLNKTAMSGIYRVNKDGQYNTPFGHRKKPCFPTLDDFKAVSKYLKRDKVTLLSLDFQEALEYCSCKDFVYLDPPYISTETGYTKQKFNLDDHRRLKLVLDHLTNKNVKWVLSNSDTDETRLIYHDYHFFELENNMVCLGKNGKPKKTELVITNFINKEDKENE